MSDPVYTKLELIAATGGKRHRDAQERVLRELGVHYKVVGGKLLVSRAHFEAVMAGQPTETPSANEPSAGEYDEGRVNRAKLTGVMNAKRRIPA